MPKKPHGPYFSLRTSSFYNRFDPSFISAWDHSSIERKPPRIRSEEGEQLLLLFTGQRLRFPPHPGEEPDLFGG